MVLNLKLCLILLLGFSFTTNAQRVLANPNATNEAKALYKYIQDMYGKKILSGQMWSGFSGDELAYIQTNTGKQPAIRGMDFITESQNNAEVQRATDWWKTGGIPTIMWHWGAPSKGEGYPSSQLTIDINRCFQPGTAEYISFWNELRIKADHLQTLRDANIPVLWRPFHELNGGWFWWSKGGAAQFIRLWTTMYNYFVNDRKLNNLIWVLCYTGSPDGSWFPGNQYVDIGGADTYTSSTGPQLSMFNQTKNSLGGNVMPIAFHECGTPPNPDQCLSQGAMWSWWMEWHTSWLYNLDKAYLKTLYNHSLVITKDEVPNIMAVYGGTTPPPPPPGTIANGTYRITARSSGKSLDVTGASTADGANVIQWTYGGGTNQQWSVQTLSAGVYSIRAVHSGKSLDVSGLSTADGGDINQWTYSGNNNQRWRIESVGSGFFRIVSVNSGKAVEITGNSSADGAAIDQRTYSGANNQQFTFQLLSSTGGTVAPQAAIQEETLIKTFVYPNPSAAQFSINQKGAFTYSVKDILGKVVEKGTGINKSDFGLSLHKGVYFLQIESANKTKTIKLVKN
jgi:Glycosyl hydrolase family 26/Ricin-type beta-trefoil lectin domain-like/Secretion system C-terminal sorting domain